MTAARSTSPAASASASRRGVGHVRLTARDRAILGWVARHRFVTVHQVRRRFGLGDSRAYRRLRELRSAGYLELQRIFVDEPGAYWITRAGLSVSDSALPPGGVDVRSYHHDLGVVELELELELEGLAVISEREMRQADMVEGRGAFSVLINRFGEEDEQRHHRPDLVVEQDGRRWALELELTPKRSWRLRETLEAYRDAPRLDAVVYYVRHPVLEARLRSLGDEIGLDEKLVLRAWGRDA